LFDVAQAPRHIRPAVAPSRSATADWPSTKVDALHGTTQAAVALPLGESDCQEFPEEAPVGSSFAASLGVSPRAESACAARPTHSRCRARSQTRGSLPAGQPKPDDR
jgi:hypothetical protein